MTDEKTEKNTVRTSCEEGIARITLQRPPLNVLNISMMHELEQALNSDFIGNEARILILQAEGKAFSAGVDVADHTPERVEEMLGIFHSVIRLLRNVSIPTVALAQGAALGGGAELACTCDLVLASEKAKFGQPEILLGVFPPVAMVDLPRIVGVRKAAEMIFGGQTITAVEAEQIGLINAVFAADEFPQRAQEFLKKLAGLSRSSLIETKAAFKEALTIADPEKALAATERRYMEGLMSTPDAEEGIAAFMEKRAPMWTHR